MSQSPLHSHTATTVKKQKNQARQARYAALNWLSQTFPHAFDNTVCIRPLKIGIMKDILMYAKFEPDLPVSLSKIREAVMLFTRRIDYLSCLKAREIRINLAGEPEIPVTEAEANSAALKIKKQIERNIRSAHRVINDELNTTRVQADDANVNTGYAANASAQSYQTQYALKNTVKVAPHIVIKNKLARQFDPEAVAQLKARLGLTR